MSQFSLSPYKAIIFDFDGVIGKTMEDNYEAWKLSFAEVGIVFSAHEYYHLEGHKALEVAEHFLNKFKPELLHLKDQLVSQKEKYYRENNSFSFYPMALELLAFCSQTKKTALVTGANRVRLEFTQNLNEETKKVFSHFTTIVTATDVKKGKPDPEPYLMALDFLKVSAKEALVIENAPLGIQSAKAAGINCVGIASTLLASDLKQADVTFKTLADFYSAVKD